MSLFPISALYKQHADIHSPPLAIGIHFAKTCLSWHAGTGTAYTLDGAFNYVSACLSFVFNLCNISVGYLIYTISICQPLYKYISTL